MCDSGSDIDRYYDNYEDGNGYVDNCSDGCIDDDGNFVEYIYP